MSSLVSGCLILEPIEFDDRQLPSYLEPIEPYSFSRAPDTSDPNCEMSGDPDPDTRFQGMLFRANVSDPNTTEALEGRIIVNKGAWSEYLPILTTGVFERGEHSKCVPLDALLRRCNLVEIVVTSSFSPDKPPYATRDPNDVAKIEWWVLGPASNTPDADQTDCADYEEEVP